MKHHEDTRIRRSKYFRAYEYEGKHIFYHTCLGNPVEVTEDYPAFLEIVDAGVTLSDLAPYPDLHAETRVLIEKGLFEYDGITNDLLVDGVLNNARKLKAGELVNLLVIDVSTNCNLACTYCNVHKTQEKHGIKGAQMDSSTAISAVNEYFKLCRRARSETAAVSYFGGEPLANPRVLFEVMEYVDKQRKAMDNIAVTHAVSTNGILLNEDRVKKLNRLRCDVSVSLDGLATINDQKRIFKNGKGSFSMVERNLKLLVEHQVPTMVVTTVDDHNCGELIDFVDFLVDTGIDQVSIKGCIYRSIPREERLEVSTRIMEAINYAREKGMVAINGPGELSYERGCQGLGEMLCVEPDGNVYACPEGIRIKLGEASTLSEIPTTPEYELVASRITGNMPECSGCDVEGLCRGGCAGESEYKFDDIYAVDRSMCDDIRENIKKNLAIFGTL